MITCEFEQIQKTVDRELRLWLGRDEFQTLVRIIEGRLKKHQAEALASALQSAPHNLKGEAAEAQMFKAQRYQHCLEVLDEVKNQHLEKLFETAKLA